MIDVGVDSSIRYEADEVEAVALGRLDSFLEDGITAESAVLNSEIDAGEFLIDDAACSEVEMSHFGISHLALGQADLESARLQSGLGISGVKLIMDWGMGEKGCVSLSRGALPACRIDPPTVTNEE